MQTERIARVRLQNLVSRYLKMAGRPGFAGSRSAAVEATAATSPPGDSILTGADWSCDWNELFEERAAIMEYDGNLERAEAERLALKAVERHFH
jgi:hypothetical protein